MEKEEEEEEEKEGHRSRKVLSSRPSEGRPGLHENGLVMRPSFKK